MRRTQTALSLKLKRFWPRHTSSAVRRCVSCSVMWPQFHPSSHQSPLHCCVPWCVVIPAEEILDYEPQVEGLLEEISDATVSMVTVRDLVDSMAARQKEILRQRKPAEILRALSAKAQRLDEESIEKGEVWRSCLGLKAALDRLHLTVFLFLPGPFLLLRCSQCIAVFLGS